MVATQPRDIQEADVTITGSMHEFWESGMRQLRAVAKRECRRIDTKIQEPSDALPASTSQTTWRAATTGGKPRTTTGLERGTGVANQV